MGKYVIFCCLVLCACALPKRDPYEPMQWYAVNSDVVQLDNNNH